MRFDTSNHCRLHQCAGQERAGKETSAGSRLHAYVDAIVAQQARSGGCVAWGLVALDEQRLNLFERAVFGLGNGSIDPQDGKHAPTA
jgi:hypothetical protein